MPWALKLAFSLVLIWLGMVLSSALAEEVKLVKEGGVYHLPVKINDAIELKFVVDTGASDVMIPADVALTLFRTGTIAESDFLGKGAYQMADGTVAEHAKLNLRTLQIGSMVIRNVKASVGPIEGTLLLGQSALEKLEPWRMETKRGAFVLSENFRTQSVQTGQIESAVSQRLESEVIYFAAENAPTEGAPSEAPLCYKFQVASPDEQLKKLKKKYPDLYGYKITKNNDGSKNLFAKRKDESGNIIDYFYTTNPVLCNEYQANKLNLSNHKIDNNSIPDEDSGWVLVSKDFQSMGDVYFSNNVARDGRFTKVWEKFLITNHGGPKYVLFNITIDCDNAKKTHLKL